jgi:hypothetical protein
MKSIRRRNLKMKNYLGGLLLLQLNLLFKLKLLKLLFNLLQLNLLFKLPLLKLLFKLPLLKLLFKVLILNQMIKILWFALYVLILSLSLSMILSDVPIVIVISTWNAMNVADYTILHGPRQGTELRRIYSHLIFKGWIKNNLKQKAE